MKNKLLQLLLATTILTACEGSDDNNLKLTGPNLQFKFEFDKTQARLDNLGNEVTIAEGHAALSPEFNSMSVHYIEFVPNKWTMVGEGAVVYEGVSMPSVSSEFEKAIVFDEAIQSGANEIFLEVPTSKLPIGTYEYMRVSVTYQNADVRFNLINLPSPLPSELKDQTGTLAGFIGFNTYITSHQVKNYSIKVNGEKPQGFWAFEPQLDDPYQKYITASIPITGQAPAGSTTVVNLLDEFGVTIPQGSCIVTGKLKEPLVITGDETVDKQVILSFSVNNSFEWVDTNQNGEWDIDVTGVVQENVVDMGLRGLIIEME
ncbi:hypothetical protein V6R21_18865 [Limibacter armeniacum]|uniref:hypothetical protein n=1 Tax=Limibacter armeniacum TaxID=466084 RepID=UPI002FE6321E